MKHNMFDNKKVIIFDMDGTLIDSIGMWNEVDRLLIDRINTTNLPVDYDNIQCVRESFHDENRCDGEPYVAYCQYLADKYHANMTGKEAHDIRYAISQQFVTNTICYKPDADKFIKQLHAEGYKLAIATNTQRRVMDIYCTLNQNIMSTAPITKYFHPVLTVQDVETVKPSPEIHNKLLAMLGVEPQDCLVFEDSLVGVQAANNAGIECVAVYDKYSDHDRDEIDKQSTYQIKCYTELIK